MADEEIIVEENDEETETELEVLQSIRDDFRYFIKCTVPNSVYVDWDYPEPEPEPEPEPDPDPETPVE